MDSSYTPLEKNHKEWSKKMPVLLLCAAVLLALYIREKLIAYSIKAALLKSVVSVLFIAVAVWSWYRSSHGVLGIFVILGLSFGLLGDIWLDFKYVFRTHADPFTYAGFAAFGIGHILYMTGLLAQYMAGTKLFYVILPIFLGIILSLGNAVLEKPMKLHFGKMKGIVIGYGVLLFSTVLLSGSLALANHWQVRTLNLFFAGAVLFALSDLVLSGTYFGVGRERPVDIISNYLLYYSGQFLIAYSLLYL